MSMMRSCLSVMTGFLLVTATATAAGAESPFPRPASLEPDIQFWTRVYTEVSTRAGYLHDSRNLGVVYETIHFPKGASRQARSRQVERVRREIRAALRSLARGKRTGLSAREKQALSRWPDGVSNATLQAASRRLRFQLGQADKFKAGLIRSGAWEPHIRRTFTEMDLPVELAALPHVESSYTPHAWSRVGAAGLWQFTRSTGRRFMRVDHVVDERLDPYKSTVAAARLLEQNRQTTGSWPLAITAYNHGAAGMRRAVRKLGTRDIDTIVRKYRSRTFGFASRNFYLEFLAAADVDFHSERYFGPLILDSPKVYETVEMPYFTTASALARAMGVEVSTLRSANPALLRSVWSEAKYIPRGFTIRLPREVVSRPLAEAVAAIPDSRRYSRQVRDTFHTVRRGEALSQIARRYGVRTSDIVALNGLRSRHRIWAGQRLRLPDSRGGSRVARAPEPQAPPTNGRYVVRQGDTLSRIASRFGMQERDLVRANGLRNRHRIYAGQVLRVSMPPEAPAPPPAPPAKATPPEAPAAAVAPDPHPEPVAELSRPAVQDPSQAAREEQDLAADPSDYSVSSAGRIEVQAAETLGHYAEWLDLRASHLRRINGMRYGDPLRLGQGLKLDFSRVDPGEFEHRRRSYHRELQAEFFGRFEISETHTHVLRRGDSLWQLSKHRYQVPLWLIRQYNPDLDFENLHPGSRITIPVVRPHGGGENAPERTHTRSEEPTRNLG